MRSARVGNDLDSVQRHVVMRGVGKEELLACFTPYRGVGLHKLSQLISTT